MYIVCLQVLMNVGYAHTKGFDRYNNEYASHAKRHFDYYLV